MSTIVFLGPTLPPAEAKSVLKAEYRPPVSQGDVYRAVEGGAQVIGIIDGFFEQVPAVWHKEILWAHTRGVHVFGAASMGALRAAELSTFGMIGVGKAFEAFQEGILEDDDEVAIAHGPADLGYPNLSEAMINIRATLEQAERDHVIGKDFRDAFVRTAKSLHFPLRRYETVLSALADRYATSDLTAFRAWLPSGRVDVKREDALAMLKTMAEHQDRCLKPGQVSFSFAHTDTWEKLIRQSERRDASVTGRELLDELRLSPDLYDQVFNRAAARALALKEASRIRLPDQPDAFNQQLHAFFVKRGLLKGQDIKTWLDGQHLGPADLIAMIKREQRTTTINASLEVDIMNSVPDVLRGLGLYGSLFQKIQTRKKRAPARTPNTQHQHSEGPSNDALLKWYFNERLKTEIPDQLDSHIHKLGLKSRHAFFQTLSKEYLYELAAADHADGSDAASLAK
ncbi:TfuA-like protein [Roseibium sp. RKSG952]|uniref:TfuA-like protein n=1 Tax=Roseibium sp. RKSG952 TaxID=2529384 RepID=UPI0012BC8B2C|nr:TfuA-like protein [Roseibium sp. RKSG952]MTH97500.1 hypothetical protein [Roseibium sp. RKSG952]